MDSRNIIVESHIPFIEGLLEPYFNVRYLDSPDITPQAVKDADAVLVRTRTRCNADLLAGSRCQFVGTCTIGLDHIDTAWCAANGIEAVNAPGCNAPAVAQYVFASILALVNRPVSQHTIGIVGVGNVGKIVERWARQLDMAVLVNDPPRQQREGGSHWASLDEIAEKADIITFHPTLNPTSRHLANTDFFAKLRRSPIIVNASRGPVVDTQALIEAIDCGLVHHAAIDTWEGEPALDIDLMKRCDITTQHIAGYSYEGKVRATRMVLDALCRHFDLPRIEMPQRVPHGAAQSVNPVAISASYDPLVDTAILKAAPSDFETLRDKYPLRREVPTAKID